MASNKNPQTNLLLQDAVSLPRLKTLIIVTCLMGISWTNDQKAYDRLPLKIHRRIVRFKVPETSALKEVSTGTIWFSRRGAALMPRHCGFRGYSYREFVYGMKAGDLSDSESEKDEEGTWWSHIRRRRRS